MEWKNHKYIAKVRISPKSFKYFYTLNEYKAFKNGKMNSDKDTSLKSIKKPDMKKPITGLTNLLNLGLDKTKDAIEKLKEKTSDGQEDRKVNGLLNGMNNNAVNNIINIGIDKTKEAMDKLGVLKLKESSGNSSEEDMPSKYKSYRDYKKAIVDGEEEIPKKNYESTPDEDMNAVNKNFSTKDYDDTYETNCAYASLAYDMRRRGYEVTADNEMSTDTLSSIAEFYEGDRKPKIEPSKNSNNSEAIKENMLKEYPEGSYGYFNVYWKGGGGHSFTWSVENGDVIIRDCQTNEKMPINECYYFDYTDMVAHMRTDDLKLSKRALLKVDYGKSR